MYDVGPEEMWARIGARCANRFDRAWSARLGAEGWADQCPGADWFEVAVRRFVDLCHERDVDPALYTNEDNTAWFEVARQPQSLPGSKWVNVYSLTRHYGGPEEGGWWYDEGELMLSIQVTDEDEVASTVEELEQIYPSTKARYNYHGGDDHSIYIEDKPGADWSNHRPWE
ncbi:YubB ferredoxin-like domain-containing protein [Nocardia ninae]|uniref:Uncharacterized protein n=1 Tax=Nocardia ninae NBRC 108245 TaxID=1210091 RepID=A0A511M9T9_9NOCA|nr:hypothetical protein NN4_19420 [Nocardia ninae NBRC 108245]